jgi:hypothetical protein
MGIEKEQLTLLITFLFGVLSTVIAALLWEWIKGTFSFRLSKFPDLRGDYTAKTESKDGKVYYEKIVLKSQFGRRIRGFFTSPDPDNPGISVEHKFYGFILDKYTIQYQYEPKNSDFSNYGVGILKLQSNYKKANGEAVSVGIANDFPASSIVQLEKK